MVIPDQTAWNAWKPRELAQRLVNLHLPWCIAGGWALDLWHGAETREHGDLEFTVLRKDFSRFRQALGELVFYSAHSGSIKDISPDQNQSDEVMQFWGYDSSAQCWRTDMMIEPGTPDFWAYRRDPSIKRPRADMVLRTADNIPYLNPSAVLLFKAKDRRQKDEEDFKRAFPKLSPSDRAWLKYCLDLLHPGHEWALALT